MLGLVAVTLTQPALRQKITVALIVGTRIMVMMMIMKSHGTIRGVVPFQVIVVIAVVPTVVQGIHAAM